MGPDDGAAVTEFLEAFSAVAPAIFRATVAVSMDADAKREAVDTVRGFLGDLEARIEAHGGPHFCGPFSLADVTAAPFMPEILHSTNPELNLDAFPRARSAMEALTERGSYKQTTVDRHTMFTIRRGLFGLKMSVRPRPSDVLGALHMRVCLLVLHASERVQHARAQW